MANARTKPAGKRMGIRTKIIGAMVLLLIFIGLISFWVSYMHERKSLLTSMQDNAVILNRALIISIANQKSIAEKVNLQTLVEDLSLTEGMFGVWVIDLDSRITAATFREQAGEVATSRYVAEVLKEGYFMSGFGEKMGEQVYSAFYPLKRENEVAGAVEVAFELRDYLRAAHGEREHILSQMKKDSRIVAESLSYSILNMMDVNKLIHIQRLVERLSRESEIISRIMIVDDHSRIIACNDENAIGLIADDRGVRQIMNGAEIYTRLFPRQKVYMVDMPLRLGDEFKGVVSIGYDATNYYAHLSQLFHFGLVISGAGIFLGVYFSFLVADPIVKPILRLTEVTRKLAAGDLSQRAAIDAGDEVGVLAGAFNQMANDLARSKEDLDRYSRTLEEKVRTRTRELEQSNQELRGIQNELVEANMAKSEFLSIASHELRTPLTTLVGYSELMLMRSLTPDQQKEFLGFIHQESIRLSKIVNDLLDISRIESKGSFEFDKKPLRLDDLLTQNIRFFSQAETDHRIVTEIEENLPLVNADREKIGQVVKNLLDNAIKYSPGGDIVCRARSENRMVWISIQDHGVGISEENIPHVFDKFYRVKRQETAHVGGTGLGLSIAKYIVEAHNGKIDLHSDVGKQTTISFGLPVLRGEKTG